MKAETFSKILFSAASFLFLTVSSAFAVDAYDELAKELCEVAKSTSQAKIAIIPFSYVDKRKSDGGAIVSERLTTRIGKFKNFQVIERSLLENVLTEQHLETSGLVDAETAKQIGKVLGVEAIINGTLLDVEDGMVEVNARMIKTETAEVMTTASVQVKKIWSDVSVNAPVQPAASEQQTYQQPAAASAKGPAKNIDGYFDVFFRSGASKMKLTFENNSRRMTESELGINITGAAKNVLGYKKVNFESMEAEDSGMPIGIRFVGYGNHWGFGWELSYSETRVAAQTTPCVLDGKTVNFTFAEKDKDYMKVGTFNFLSGDLLYRFSKGMIQPYAGIGLGFTLNTLSSIYVMQSGGKFEAMGLGFIVRFPVFGVRVNLGESASMFGEFRSTINSVSFDRNVTNETDSVAVQSSQVLLGIGFRM